MIDIETVSKNSTARCLKIIEATPEALRECANRIEQAMSMDLSRGESVICELTSRIHVIYKPDAHPPRLPESML